jgi:OmpA-OmpF porin, OOP family
MLKKTLLVSACALGLSSVAFAGGLPEEMPPAPCATAAVDSGIYIGVEGGFEMTNWKNIQNDVISVSKDNNVGARGFLGYDINKYFAIEAGFTQLGFTRTEIGFAGTPYYLGKILTEAVDLELKIKAPVTDEFYLYGKVGADFMWSNVSGANIPPFNMSNVNNLNVLYGAGADYLITPNVVANIEWMRYNGYAKITSDSYQPYADAFMIGIRYRFDM